MTILNYPRDAMNGEGHWLKMVLSISSNLSILKGSSILHSLAVVKVLGIQVICATVLTIKNGKHKHSGDGRYMYAES